MFTRSAMFALVLMVAALAPAPLVRMALASADDYWQVWGKQQNTGEDVPMSAPFETKAAAEAELRSIERNSYIQGGLLYDDPGKPIKGTLRVRHFKSDGTPDKEPPRDDKNYPLPAVPMPGGKPKIAVPIPDFKPPPFIDVKPYPGKEKPKANSDAGPFRLFLGQYSNTADLKGGGSGEEFQSLADARAKAARHMSANATKQPSYRIEDKDGNVIEARGLFKNIRAK
jgi:hypothetical protein